jgi:hypothetical protein
MLFSIVSTSALLGPFLDALANCSYDVAIQKGALGSDADRFGRRRTERESSPLRGLAGFLAPANNAVYEASEDLLAAIKGNWPIEEIAASPSCASATPRMRWRTENTGCYLAGPHRRGRTRQNRG